MIRRLVMISYVFAAISIVPLIMVSVWVDGLSIIISLSTGFVLLPIIMSIIEWVIKGNTAWNTWFWSGQKPWPKQDHKPVKHDVQ